MKPLNRLISYTVAHVTLIALFSIAAVDSAFSQADFYSGKTITIIRGGGPGGSGEFQTRSLMRVLGKHIPGRPSFTLQYVDGCCRQEGHKRHLQFDPARRTDDRVDWRRTGRGAPPGSAGQRL